MSDGAAQMQDIDPQDNDLHGNFDAKVWAGRFVLRATGNPAIATDEGTMLAWFAGAIMTGYDHAHKVIAEDNAGKAAAADRAEPPLPDGIYGRIELPGRREHTGWVTDETRFGVQAAVVRDWDGREIAAVFPGPACRFVYLATPLRRPEPPRALGVAVEGWDSPEDSVYDEAEREGEPF